MEKLRIYRIRDGFIEFLHEKDHRVQFNKRERRPYIGVVLEINGHKYFVPMESPKPNHEKLKSNVHIMRIDGGKYGILGFNNMVPAKDFFLVPFDIEKSQTSATRTCCGINWNSATTTKRTYTGTRERHTTAQQAGVIRFSQGCAATSNCSNGNM